MAIARIRRTPLKYTRRGYVRQLGWTVAEEGGRKYRAKFYLGHDQAEAAVRRKHIEALFLENSRNRAENQWWFL